MVDVTRMGRGAAALRRLWRRRAGTWWWAIVVIVVPVVVIAAAAVTALLLFVTSGTPQNQIELIKVGLTVGAGTGGVVALVLNGRRQWSTEHDARERRLTELYLKAVEQLGSDRAAIRHGGLYALERVAQDNPTQRQTVVDVFCAYLRGPYSSPPESGQTRRLGVRRPLLTASAARRRVAITRPSATAPKGETSAAEVQQEREVRLTVQRILGRRLRPGADPDHPADTFWADIDIDLTGATLINFNLDLAGAPPVGPGHAVPARPGGMIARRHTCWRGRWRRIFPLGVFWEARSRTRRPPRTCSGATVLLDKCREPRRGRR